MTFQVSSATLVRRDLVAVTFSAIPLSANPAQAGDALRPAAYVLAGPGSATITSVSEDLADLTTLLLQTSSPLAPGSWSLTVAGVHGPGGATITSDTVDFTVPVVLPPARLATNPLRGYDIVAQALGPAMVGPNWEALKKALGWSMQKDIDYNTFAARQLFLDSAEGRWLAKRSAENGLGRPLMLGMSDDRFRNLAESFVWGKLTQPGLLSILDAFYGPDRTRAIGIAELPEPYSIDGGEYLVVEVGGLTTHRLDIAAVAISAPGAAGALEVASALNYSADELGAKLYFDVVVLAGQNYLRAISAAAGLGARLRFLGGTAQRALRLPQRIAAFVDGDPQPTWTITSVPLDAAMELACIDPTGEDLSVVHPGDYAVLLGSEFASTNRGIFEVLDVSITISGGSRTQVVKLANPAAAGETVTQLAEDSLLFFRPTSLEQDPAGPILTQAPGKLSIVLPTTSLVVNRDLETAGYLHDWPSFEASASRLDGIVTFSKTAHSLSAGQTIDCAAPRPTFSARGTVSGGGGLSDYSPLSIWSQAPDMSTARLHHAAAILPSGAILVVGGYDGAAYTTSAEIFAVSSDAVMAGGGRQLGFAWTTAASLGTGLGFFTLTRPPTTAGVVLVGGYDGTNPHDEVYLYDELTDTWASRSAYPFAPLFGHSAVGTIVSGIPTIFVIGGNDGASPLDATYTYAPLTDTWTAAANLIQARYRSSSAITGSLLMTSGGLDAADEPTPTCEVLDTSIPMPANWTQVGSMAWARYGHALVVLPDGRIMAIGGRGRRANEPYATEGPIDEIEIFDPEQRSWSSGGRLAEAMGIGVSALLNSRVFAGLGGIVHTYGRSGVDGRWCRSTALADISPLEPVFAGSDWLLACGGDLSGATAKARVLIPNREAAQSAGPPRFQRITSVPDANTFVVSDPLFVEDVSAWSAVTVSAGPAEGDWAGPYAYSPTSGLAATAGEVQLTQALDPGKTYNIIGVTASPPTGTEWIAFDLGGPLEAGPFRCLGPASTNQIRVEISGLSRSIPTSTMISPLAGKGPYLPPARSGGLYAAPSDAAPVKAKEILLATSGAGLLRDIAISYPGDRGLGAEDFPASGTGKLSDQSSVWSGK